MTRIRLLGFVLAAASALALSFHAEVHHQEDALGAAVHHCCLCHTSPAGAPVSLEAPARADGPVHAAAMPGGTQPIRRLQVRTPGSRAPPAA